MATNQGEALVGNNAIENISNHDWSCRYPVEFGYPTNWDYMEEIYRFAFAQLSVDPSTQPILATDSAYGPKLCREKLAELMFETFEVPQMYVAIQPALALFASGRSTGIVLQLGGGLSNIIPLYEGYPMPHAYNRLDIAGNELSDFMVRLCKGDVSSRMYRQACTNIKENFCFVAPDNEREIQTEEDHFYKLPDGEVIRISGEACVNCPEALFNPNLYGKEMEGIHKLANRSITRCEIDIINELYGNIVLSGGCSLFPGLSERLKKEIQCLAPEAKVRIISPPERIWAPWIGGSIKWNEEQVANEGRV
eukprot:CAMPEP_0206194484 /NCGR_PEP_ID=MMETSP0166-20121206/7225_1 /ASSEMBLY_ACC=CAM_ASM_000260 /TAXON_ID=95228 /ORGANISM="Vannella robusta, Strain DIVA3 518/3/11/1/6" /LENGTH=307 /DNA_ID=CAMNT_0053611467 /DNA_START=238 /DNA_END=1161 /DNA_ORIENTATION=+